MSDERVPFWKSDFTADQRRTMARNGQAMSDGSYPIPNAEYLEKAIRAVGRGSNNSHAAIRKHIIARAKALGLTSRLPDSWHSDGTVEKSEDVAVTVELWKSDSDHMVYGVVLNPGVEDSQGDVATPVEIEKAAHRFMTDYRSHDVQHSGVAADIVPVESFIAPQDLDIAGQRVLKGAWVLGAKVNDTAAWERVCKGELTGWSIEGSAVREPITA